MSVLKNLQALSDLEFYRCAVKLQDDITDFCLRDFGLKRSPRSVKQIIRNIEEADQKTIDTIFAKYGKTPSQQFASEYPEWFIRRRKLLSVTAGDKIEADEPLLTMYAANDSCLDEAETMLACAIEISDEKPPVQPLIRGQYSTKG